MTNKHKHRLPERWYRDVWLLVVTAIVLFAVNSAQNASDRAVRAVHAVQANRIETIARQCRNQNARNRATVARLNAEINALADTRSRARAERTKEFTIGLINTLDPVQDCRAVVSRARVSQ